MNALPAGWAAATVGDVTLPIRVVDPKIAPDTTFTYVDIGSIDNRSNRIADPKSIRGRDAPSRARQLLQAGDTVFSTVRTYLRNIGFVDGALSGAIGSTGFAVLRPALGVHARFLYYYTLTSAFVDGLSAQMRGTSYPAVVDSQVRAMPIPMAPTAEQDRIVAAIEEQFSRLDAGVGALERVQQNLKRMRATVLELTIDREWPQRQLKDVCLSVTDGDHQPPPQASSGIPFLVIGNVRSGHIDLSDCRRVPEAYYAGLLPKRRPQKGDVLYTVVGSYGIPVLVESNEAFCVQRHIAILRPSPEVDAKYLRYALGTSAARRQADSCATGTAQMTVPLSGLRRMTVGLPPLDRQGLVVAKLDAIETSIDRIESDIDHQNRRARLLRSSVLAAAFTGKLARQDPNDEPASVLLERIAAERGSSNGHKTARAVKKRTTRTLVLG